MNKIRLGSKTKVTLEVNDQGETISFDIGDPSFLNKAQQMALKAEQAQKEFDERFQDLDRYIEESTDDDLADDLLDDKMIELGQGFADLFADLRLAVDGFLGQGASQKIYGDDNYLSMFDDLFESLKPYFDEGAELQKKEIENAKKEALKKIPKDHKRSL